MIPAKIEKNKIISIGILLLVAAGAAAINPRFEKKAPSQAAQEAKDVCFAETLSREKCYAKEMSKIAQAAGPEFAFGALFALQKLDSDAFGCHFISHGIGEGTYQRSPNDWQKYMQSINGACNYGALHGIIENYVASLPGGALTSQVIRDVCGNGSRADCNHIMGHLLLVETSVDADQALDLCGVFENDGQLFNCYAGVFMEYQTAENLIAHRLVPASWHDWPARIGELEEMCRSAKDLQATACWKEISHAADMVFDHEPAKIFEFCESAQVDAGKKECKRHAIAILATRAGFDYEKLKPMCEIQSSDPNFAQDCYQRLAITSLYSKQDSVGEVKEYCSTIPAAYQKSCFAEADSFTRNLNQRPISD